MNSENKTPIWQNIPDQDTANTLLNRLFDVAHTDSVFSKPVTQGDYSVITASEVMISMGAGFGGGGQTGIDGEETAESSGGGGGGGLSMGRPVAAIAVGPGGIQVEPIVDPTKISIAFFTTLAAMVITLLNVIRVQKSKKL